MRQLAAALLSTDNNHKRAKRTLSREASFAWTTAAASCRISKKSVHRYGEAKVFQQFFQRADFFIGRRSGFQNDFAVVSPCSVRLIW
jgi:hypothetical protein